MASNTVRSLIYEEILATQPKFFRNKDIVLVTGADRQRVYECIQILMREGILTKSGPDYWVSNVTAFIKFLLKGTVIQEDVKTPTKMLHLKPEQMDGLLAAMQIVDDSKEAKDWQPHSIQLKEQLLDDIDDSIKTLQRFRYEMKNTTGLYAHKRHLANGKKWAGTIQFIFQECVKNFTGTDISDASLLTDYVRPALRENFGYDDSIND